MGIDEHEPMISVVVPVYNGSKYLGKTIDSLLLQSYGCFEAFFVDDESQDDSVGIVEHYALLDPRIKLLKKEHGGRVVESLNAVLPLLSGHFYFYMSQDDLLSSDLFDKMVKRMKCTGADAVLPDMHYYFDEGSDRNSVLAGLKGDHDIVISGREALQYSLDWTIHGFALFRINIVKRLGFEEFSLNSDEYSVRIFYLNCKTVAFSEGVFYYRQHDQSITRTVRVELFEVLETNRRLYDLVVDNGFDYGVCNRVILSNASWLVIFMNMYFRNRKKFTPDGRKLVMKRLRKSFSEIDKRRLFVIKTENHRLTAYLWMVMFFHDNFLLFYVLSFVYGKLKK
ncbi:MAG: glycosyltransferase family 2 protein [Chlorobiaceae bacterium]|nr:glycosyltransferase family 2 protein [Chlorobiaceae bacterium]